MQPTTAWCRAIAVQSNHASHSDQPIRSGTKSGNGAIGTTFWLGCEWSPELESVQSPRPRVTDYLDKRRPVGTYKDRRDAAQSGTKMARRRQRWVHACGRPGQSAAGPDGPAATVVLLR